MSTPPASPSPRGTAGQGGTVRVGPTGVARITRLRGLGWLPASRVPGPRSQQHAWTLGSSHPLALRALRSRPPWPGGDGSVCPSAHPQGWLRRGGQAVRGWHWQRVRGSWRAWEGQGPGGPARGPVATGSGRVKCAPAPPRKHLVFGRAAPGLAGSWTASFSRTALGVPSGQLDPFPGGGGSG